ncbi:helix-turn-helix domain-containing protein [Streptomyces sp.]|uniref:helix-turn-helix domain-containing protein n=1 Tax=Streptomyces sp. TaxID=1931 RepID=UPI002F3EC596
MPRPPRPAPSMFERYTCGRLRGMREAAGMTSSEVGVAVRVVGSTVARWENGDRAVPYDKAEAMMRLYGTTGEAREQWHAEYERATEPGWWHEYRDVVPDWHALMLADESAASMVRGYSTMVPALYQAPEYRRALIRRTRPGLDARTIDRHLGALAARQRLLTRDQPPDVWMVMPEEALTALDPDLMRTQVDHLLALLELPHVALQIVPLRGLRPQLVPFHYLRFAPADWPDAVYLPALTCVTQLADPDQVTVYLSTLDALSAGIAGARDTPDILRRIRAGAS